MNGWRWSVGRLLLLAFCSTSFWWIACWWTGPIIAYRVPMDDGVTQQIIGFSSRGDLVAVGPELDQTRRERVLVWKLEASQRTVVWRGEPSPKAIDNRFALSANGRWLNVVTAGSRVVLDLDTFETIPHAKLGEVWISPDGRLLFNDDRQTGVEVSEFRTGKPVGRIDDSWIHDISPNGEWVLASNGDDFRVWRIGVHGVSATALTFTAREINAGSAIDIGPQGGALVRQQSKLSRFSPDSKMLVLEASGGLEVWQLDPLAKVVSSPETAYAISADCRRAWLSDERVVTLPDGAISDTAAGKDDGVTLVQPIDDDSLFIAIRQSWRPRAGSGGFSIPIGPYDFSLTPRHPSSGAIYCLKDAISGREVAIPRFIAKPYDDLSTGVMGGSIFLDEESSPRFFLHPDRLAIVSPDHACWIIPFPPTRPWRKQLAVWAVLTLPVAWRVLRRRRNRKALSTTRQS